MSTKFWMFTTSLLIIALLAACAPAATPETIIETVEVEKTVIETVEVEVEKTVIETVEVEVEVAPPPEALAS